ncbi:L,D-transpeptidase family protein [Sulfitobacter geojensis]|uniref:L,D-transpeptidase family protein n=1 Tax=Sulfitobacter geojensis TaxID=1342299 RepID=A0AAE2VVK3_9RHOB|nr:L,D-transpeptidase family protein [Sulfitobacter geojensis]MBM1688195.1 L,D-transpeptidase family protein [Sulfitobacter geojensis]MBM1692262.1 L,D-transpeptidase family protein [Sulfitobacter geojensis]MBM1704428.1 L,D-transpeptidase family protein [Sulfitobacter geojensis]MBM1708486.1 L,D-transpeptidase family protein [Sulfitobacter geojensis]MBM1712551.1 L,D-transpeptidase family protein [Sulfitobacter geojensis]
MAGFVIAFGAAVSFAPRAGSAQVTAFKQAIAEAAAQDDDIAAFYRANGYSPIWTGAGDVDRNRRAELLRAIRSVASHGLPVARYDPDGLMKTLASVRTARDRGMAEVEMSRVFLKYARDIQTGMLTPKAIDPAMVREIPYRERGSYLSGLAEAKPAAFFRALPPTSMEYNALIKEKVAMERLLLSGGWGATVPAKSLKPGDSGNAVIALRNRLIAMEYLERTNTREYDADMQAAVQQFQIAHGLNDDGVAGVATMNQINVGVEKRLQSVLVALERERWFNTERGKRHILVNLPDFSAKIIDDDKLTFYTRSVIGANRDDRPTPEFSDTMTHMVVNPSWYVPRSIVTKEYLPALKRNYNAASHIEITDRRGRKINRAAVNFSQFTERNFPYAMRQPPSKSNALGLVKFMFPNKYNIYLHDTPAKSLFSRDVRAFSHGCVRLAQPFEFAYELLSKQEADPKGHFQSILRSRSETKVVLDTPVPVHLIYRTAVTNARGHTEYRADVYGRDAKIWNALSRAGVVLGGVQG